jgi:membrane dipeptidase
MRLWGYNIDKAHGKGLLRGRFAGHLDLPRIFEAGVGGAMWSVTTNPFRTRKGRWRTVIRNFRTLREKLEHAEHPVEIVSSYADFVAARERGAHVCMLSIQGGNALDGAPGDDVRPDPDLLRVTLVHLTNSPVGESSQPLQTRRATGLSEHGRTLVRRLNDSKVFVDLAHISKRGFWDAVREHDPSQPLLVTHTGVEGVTPHWRNIDDEQIRAIADSGGTVGIMYHTPFLKRDGAADRTMVVDHMEHVIKVAGEDFVSIGTDYDGAITPPSDLRSGDSYPRLAQEMLDRRWSTTRIEKVLADNFLRGFRHLRP